MAYVVHSKHESRIGIYEQSTWGTAGGAADVFRELPNVAVSFDGDVKLRRPDRSFASQGKTDRIADVLDIQNDTDGAAPKVTIAGDVRKDDLADFLYLVMQSVTEAASTPYLKTFVLPATQPDFTANAGMFASLCHWHPNASESELITDAILSELSLSVAPGAGDDRLQASRAFIGRGAMSRTFNPSGTWTRAVESHFYFQDLGGLKVNFASAVSLDPLEINLTIRNNATPTGVEVGAAIGKFQTFALPRFEITGMVRVLYSATSAALLAYLDNGGDGQLKFWWGNETPSADGDLQFDLNVVLTSAPRVLEDIHALELNFEAVTDVTNAADAITVKLADDVDRGW